MIVTCCLSMEVHPSTFEKSSIHSQMVISLEDCSNTPQFGFIQEMQHLVETIVAYKDCIVIAMRMRYWVN